MCEALDLILSDRKKKKVIKLGRLPFSYGPKLLVKFHMGLPNFFHPDVGLLRLSFLASTTEVNSVVV